MFKSMKRIIRWAGKYKGRLYLGSVCSFFSSLSTAIPTMAAAFALDKAIQAYWTNTAIDTVLIWQMLGIIIGSIALNFLLSYLRAVLQESIGYEVAAGQRIHLGDVLKRVPLGYFSQNSVGDILAGVTTELSTLELQGMKMVDVIINGYAKFIAIVLCLIFFSPVAAVISIVGVALSALALQGISRHSEKNAATTHKAMEDMSGAAIEYIRGLSIVKSFGQEGASIENFRNASKDLKDIHIKVEKGFTPFNCLHLFALKLASMGIVFICAWQALQGQMSMAFFLMFVLFSFVMFGSVENINDAAHMLGVVDSAMNKLEALENVNYIDRAGTDIKPTSYDIEFRDVSFGYDSRIVLHDLNFKIPQNSTTAIVGPSGSGKSTLCNLIARFYDVNSGMITIGGTDIRRFTCDSLLKNILAAQDDRFLLLAGQVHESLMGVAMMTDLMPRLIDLPQKCGMILHHLSGHKKSRWQLIAVQKLQQARHRAFGAVIAHRIGADEILPTSIAAVAIAPNGVAVQIKAEHDGTARTIGPFQCFIRCCFSHTITSRKNAAHPRACGGSAASVCL